MVANITEGLKSFSNLLSINPLFWFRIFFLQSSVYMCACAHAGEEEQIWASPESQVPYFQNRDNVLLPC